jgi:phosphoglycerate kinase
MPTTSDSIAKLCHILLGGAETGPKKTLAEYLDAVPQLDSLADVPSGTTVLVRGDVDAKPDPKVHGSDIRLVSMKETLEFGRRKGWKQVIVGHIGRDPSGSLAKVTARLGEILGCDVPLLTDWMDDASGRISDAVATRIATAAPGSVFVLENARRYSLETILWRDATTKERTPSDDDIKKYAPQLAQLANDSAAKIASVYVNEAFSAGSLDASSTILPSTMKRVALGKYIRREFDRLVGDCTSAELVVFSGLKADKLDDLEAIIDRGVVRWVLAGGSLAMALKKAEGERRGGRFSIGEAEIPPDKSKGEKKPFYIPPDRIEQAKRMLAKGEAAGIKFVLPVDFVLQDKRASETIGEHDVQLDVGPKSRELFSRKIDEFIASVRGRRAVAFHNGVLGKFEEPPFDEGTKSFMRELKKMKDAGVAVYVGGGEGGAALEKYGEADWVTHVFTAGGTVLNALGGQPVPYLVALTLAGDE